MEGKHAENNKASDFSGGGGDGEYPWPSQIGKGAKGWAVMWCNLDFYKANAESHQEQNPTAASSS